jgi:hypothetical protein
MRVLLGVVLALGLSGCVHNPPDTTGGPTPAQVKVYVDLGRTTVLFVCGVDEASLATASVCPLAGSLQIGVVKEIVNDTHALDAVLNAAGSGWQAAVRAAWHEALPRIGDVQNQSVRIALQAITALVDLVFDGTRAPAIRRAA